MNYLFLWQKKLGNENFLVEPLTLNSKIIPTHNFILQTSV